MIKKILLAEIFSFFFILVSCSQNSVPAGKAESSIHKLITLTKAETINNKESDQPEEERALVVFNLQSEDSKQIANYYAKARNIPNSFLCGVQVRNSLYGTPDDLLSVRAQILNGCLCQNFAVGELCNADNVQNLMTKENLPTHLAIIQGIPTQLRKTPWGATTNTTPSYVFESGNPVSFDYYLAYSLLNEKANCLGTDCLFGTNSNGLTSLPWQTNYSPKMRLNSYSDNLYYTNTYSGMIAPLNPTLAKAFAYGRIEGITVDAALKVIDRTLLAEKNGVTGNIYGSNAGYGAALGARLSENLDSLDSECIEASLGASFPVEGKNCRLGWNSAEIPPSVEGNVKSVENIMAFFGEDPMFNIPWHLVQYGFINDSSRLLKWKKTASTCHSLCSDFTSASEVAACKENSVDPLKELNTDCVGVNTGFFGSQMRSYPVQFMGVYAPGWKTINAGPATATPMQLSQFGGKLNNRFQDTKHIYFGDPSYRRSNECSNAVGNMTDCDPKTEIYTYKNFTINQSYSLDSSGKNVKFSFYWKGYSAKPGHVLVKFYFVSTQSQVYGNVFDVLVNGETNDWQLVEGTFNLANPSHVELGRLSVSIESPSLTDADSSANLDRIPLSGYFAIDGLQVTDITTQREFILSDEGSFNEPYNYSNPYTNYFVAGDWAGQIQRLGGVAWFGSLSHFYTAGHGFADHATFMKAFLNGRTIGESLLYEGRGMSAIIYADPLYSPFTSALFIDSELFEKGAALATKTISPIPTGAVPSNTTIKISNQSPEEVKNAPLRFKSKFGAGGAYDISLCYGPSTLSTCQWDLLEEGISTGETQTVESTSRNGLIALSRGTGYHFIRLRTYSVDHPENAIAQIAKIFFISNEIPAEMMFSYVRVTSTSWNYYLKEAAYDVGSLLNEKPSLWQSGANRFEVRCNKTFGLCNPNDLSLQVTSTANHILPSYTKSVFQDYDIYGNLVTRVVFDFNSAITNCDKINFVMTNSTGMIVHLNSISLAQGDFDEDGDVDITDFAALRANMDMTNSNYLVGDINGDRSVNNADYVLFKKSFGCVVPK